MFKVGDRVRLVKDPREWAPLGFEAVLFSSYGALSYRDTKGNTVHILEDHWALVEDRSKWHPHHDLIVAWAEGANIEYKSLSNGYWMSVDDPCWNTDYQYRIKPTPQQNPHESEIQRIELDMRKLADDLARLKADTE